MKDGNLLQAAQTYAAAGLSVLPGDRKDKSPVGYLLPRNAEGRCVWSPFKERIAGPETLRHWFTSERVDAVILICGAVSGNLEVIDHDVPGLFPPWCDLVDSLAPGVLARLPLVQTQGGGCHVYYRCEVIEGNQRLARRAGDGKTMIETRGEGGYVLTCPTEGYTLLLGDLAEVPTIEPEERAILLDAARTFNERVKVAPEPRSAGVPSGNGRPGDDFNERGEVLPILERHGWAPVHQAGDAMRLRRPGKDRGVSATWNHVPRRFYVFSTNAHPFESETAYSPFAVYALLEHGGDFAAAARALAAQGYGDNGLREPSTRGARLTPTAIVPERSGLPDLEACPPLPEEAQLDPALGAGAGVWVGLYTTYASAISPMTPLHFHDSAALFLAAVAIARRLVLRMPFGLVYPNLFVVWIAITTLYRKTTALDVVRNLFQRILPHLMAAQETTPESFLSDLAGREPAKFDALSERDKADWRAGRDYAAQKGWVLDEISGLLAASGRDYNAGLIEALLRFYDCDPYFARSTRGQGRVVVRNSYLSMLGCSTPAAMSPHLTAERLWSMGWWSRFAVLTPESSLSWQRAQEVDEPQELASDLLEMYDRLPTATWPDPPAAKTVILGKGVYEAWERYNKALSYDLLITGGIDHRLHGTYGRLPVQVLKVATILSALDWQTGNAPVIELSHLARAISICETWRASAHRALVQATVGSFDKLRQRILRQIGRFEPDGATLRDLYRHMQDKTPADIQDVLVQLVNLGEVEVVEAKPGKKGGRPTVRYRLTGG